MKASGAHIERLRDRCRCERHAAWALLRQGFGRGLHGSADAGFITCPLTLFAMFLARAREVPEAGLTFAHSMFLGVGLNLGAAQDVFPIEGSAQDLLLIER